MGYQIVKQSNGKLALWATTIDNFVMINADRLDIINFFNELEESKNEKKVDDVINIFNTNGNPYYQFTQTFDECLRRIGEVHGYEEVRNVLDDISEKNKKDVKIEDVKIRIQVVINGIYFEEKINYNEKWIPTIMKALRNGKNPAKAINFLIGEGDIKISEKESLFTLLQNI